MKSQKLTLSLKLRIRKVFSQIHGLHFTATNKDIKKVYPKFDARSNVHWYTLAEKLLNILDDLDKTPMDMVKDEVNKRDDIVISMSPSSTFMGVYHKVYKRYNHRGEEKLIHIGSIGYSDMTKKYEYSTRTITRKFNTAYALVNAVSKHSVG